MPILEIPNLEAVNDLRKENSKLIVEKNTQLNQKTIDILLVNLMPTKATTEKQFLRLLAHSPYLVNVTLINMETHIPKNTSQEYLDTFYQGFSDIKDQEFDGMIITGAPLEDIHFSEVSYFEEFTDLLDWSRSHVTSTLYICWGAQAALHYFHDIERIYLDEKVFGIYEHHNSHPNHPLTDKIGENFSIPHSRYTTFDREDFELDPNLDILVDSEEVGPAVLINERTREIFITGHPEYDKETLELEYQRDKARGLSIGVPENYYPDNNPDLDPVLSWHESAQTLYTNWLHNYTLSKVKNY